MRYNLCIVMSKLPDYSNRERAFLMYSAGIKPADIARHFDVSPNTINSWKNDDDWDSRIQSEGSIESDINQELLNIDNDKDKPELVQTLQTVIKDAIKVDKIKPKTWKDVLDTIVFLTRGTSKSISKTKTNIKDITDLEEKELDKEIQALASLVKLEEEDAEIIIQKNGDMKIH
jgi:hypothetical protein